MKNSIIKVIITIVVMVLVTGCGSDYKKLSYVDYNEYFNKKEGYMMIDDSSKNGLEIIRELQASNGDIQVIYMEFSNDEEARKYIRDTYTSEDGYKLKTKDNYTIIKDTKARYFKLYRVDNIIIYASANDKKNKREINNIFKDLGY